MNPPTQIAVKTKQKLAFLDGLRGVAALYVMIGHARWLLWEGYVTYTSHPSEYGMFNKILVYVFSLFKYGHEVVLFFFVLSGFVIHLKYALNYNKTEVSRFNYSEYLGKRIRRIYPPFIFAILLTLVLDKTGAGLKFSIYSGSSIYPLINENIGNADLSLKSFFGGLFFIYPNYYPLFGTNGPAWSLKYEWWFYMLYPLFLLMGTRRIFYPTIVIIILFVFSFYPHLWPIKLLPDIFSMMITWWLGVLLAEVYAGRLKVDTKILSLTTLVIFLKLVPFTFPNIWNDFIMAVFFFGIMSFLLSLKEENWLLQKLTKLKITGDFSYTLYIIHFPILVFISGWVMKTHNNALPEHFAYVFAGIIITVLVAYLFHFVTEVPFIRRRQQGITKISHVI